MNWILIGCQAPIQVYLGNIFVYICKSMTLDDTNDVDNFILGKDSSNSDLFLKLADSRAVLLHQSQMLLDDLLLSQIISPLAGLGKSLLL